MPYDRRNKISTLSVAAGACNFRHDGSFTDLLFQLYSCNAVQQWVTVRGPAGELSLVLRWYEMYVVERRLPGTDSEGRIRTRKRAKDV